MYDLIIKDGTIIDGQKTGRYQADIGLSGEKIAKVGQIDPAEGEQVIDASGRIVAPGFIDVHTHADGWLLKTDNFASKTTQGVTTEILMADGISYAPVNRHTVHDWFYYLRGINGLQFSDYSGWESIADYMALLDRKTAQNTATHIPYANVRTLACGFGRPGPDDVQMSMILGEIEKGMAAGAVGLSTGLDYIVECWASTDELVEACRAIAPWQGLYVTHIRYRKGILPAVQEAVEIGKRAGVPVHISHLKADTADGTADALLKYIDEVAVNEVDFSFDVYPYMASSTMLNYLFPPEVWQDGPQQVYKHLRRPEVQTRSKAALAHIDLNDATIAWLPSKANSKYIGQTLAQYVAAIDQSPLEGLTNLLIEENLAVLLVFNNGNDDQVAPFLAHPNFILGSDGIYQPEGKIHPRHFGSFGRMLGYFCREKGLFSLEEAVHKMTGLPAERFGLLERGTIKEGYAADLTLFDPETVADQATFGDPYRSPSGIDTVLVNGTVIVEKGEAVKVERLEQPGRALRFKQAEHNN